MHIWPCFCFVSLLTCWRVPLLLKMLWVVDATNHSGDYRSMSLKVHYVGITIVQQLLSRLLSLVSVVYNVATRSMARATSADVNIPHHSTTTHQVHERRQGLSDKATVFTSSPQCCAYHVNCLFFTMLCLSRRLDNILEPSPTVWQV